MNDRSNDDTRGRVPRAEIEALCLLHAIGDEGCELGPLAVRIGFGASHAGTVGTAVAALSKDGYTALDGLRATRTEAGTRWLRARLAALLPAT